MDLLPSQLLIFEESYFELASLILFGMICQFQFLEVQFPSFKKLVIVRFCDLFGGFPFCLVSIYLFIVNNKNYLFNFAFCYYINLLGVIFQVYSFFVLSSILQLLEADILIANFFCWIYDFFNYFIHFWIPLQDKLLTFQMLKQGLLLDMMSFA